MSCRGLGYIGIESTDPQRWKTYGTDVLGLMPVDAPSDASPTDSVWLKMDQRHSRVAVHPGERDHCAYVGWEYPDPAELEIACGRVEAAGILSREGYNDHLAGHITYRQPDGTFLVNPFGLVWGELRGSDIMSMDGDGNLLGGKWTITPAIQVHLELHRTRDVAVALNKDKRIRAYVVESENFESIHNHSAYAMIEHDKETAA